MKKRLGAYTGETNRCRKRRTVRTRTGGMSRAVYQTAGTLARNIRENRPRKPFLPSTILVSTMPAKLGPRSMTGNIRMPVIFPRGWLWTKCGAATASAPAQEIVNVSAKYVTTGQRLITPPWNGSETPMHMYDLLYRGRG